MTNSPTASPETTPDLPDGRLALLGLGVENRALATWLAHRGRQFTVCDANPDLDVADVTWRSAVVDVRLGADYLDDVQDFDLLFRSPGLHALNPQLSAARAAGVLVSSQTQVFLDCCSAFVVGVTGTKGKGTTASLLASILVASGRPHVLAGNIGIPPIGLVDDLAATQIVVLELSSFQLQDLTRSPQAAIILPVGVDHLDVHASRDEYVQAKSAICRYQKPDAWVVAAAECETAQRLAATSAGRRIDSTSLDHLPGDGVCVADDQIQWWAGGHHAAIAPVDAVPLRGRHNLANACAAVAAARLLGVPDAQIEAGLRSFEPLPHRLEEVDTIGGVLYVNDSLGTTPVAASAAIDAYADRPLAVIVGGSSKGADYEPVGRALAGNSCGLVLLGEEGPKIAAAAQLAGYGGPVTRATDMMGAVNAAQSCVEGGGVVLLAPGCASFGMFKDYADRGAAFRQAVRALRGHGN